MRKIIDFNSDWLFEQPGREPALVTLPHTWNATDGQDGGNDYFRGTCTYTKTFSRPDGECIILDLPAAGQSATVTLNGKELSHHDGGYSAFHTDLTPALADENTLVITVDNSAGDRVYPQKADFTFYGGLYRGAKLLVVPTQHLTVFHITPTLKDGKAEILFEAWAIGEGTVTFECETQKFSAEMINGKASAKITIQNPHLWDGLNDPFLYTASATFGADEITTKFGVRTFSCSPTDGFILNGKPYPLRGVSRHQDVFGKGNAVDAAHFERDMEIIRELGANTLRLAHYQHAREFYDLCDEVGIVVWAEIPYITAHMPAGRENTITQMTELITECYNHPSIICWGLSNEITAATPVDDDMLENHRILNDLAHKLDPTRLTTMAHVFMLSIDSPIIAIPDISSYNLYFGWYVEGLENNEKFFDEFHSKYPDRIIGFSEYGADANPAYHSARPERSDYSEPYQCLYHEHIIKMINERPWLWATHVWNMFDFAADGRDEGGKPGQNQKGLVTFDRAIKKDAFYLYKAHWSKEEFVHICGRRYVDRPEPTTEIKVYTNLPTVSLYVDGALVATADAIDHIARFNVPISSEHIIEARASESLGASDTTRATAPDAATSAAPDATALTDPASPTGAPCADSAGADCASYPYSDTLTFTDTIKIRKVDKPNPDYAKPGSSSLTNWFDRPDEVIKEGYFSIMDSISAVKAHPDAAAVYAELVDPIQAKAAAAFGDVASGMRNNAALAKFFESMTIESALKQLGGLATPELVRTLNTRLNQIKK